MKSFFKPGGWHEKKLVYWKVFVGLYCVGTSTIDSLNLTPLHTCVSKKLISVSDISAVNLQQSESYSPFHRDLSCGRHWEASRRTRQNRLVHGVRFNTPLPQYLVFRLFWPRRSKEKQRPSLFPWLFHGSVYSCYRNHVFLDTRGTGLSSLSPVLVGKTAQL